MPELDTIAPNYLRATHFWPGAPLLAKSYDSLSACYASGSHGLVENTKAFIETVCRTVISEHGGEEQTTTPSTTDLLVSALKILGISNTKGASKLDKVLSNFNRLSDALTEARNESGPVAHGKDGFLDAIASEHERIFLLVGDVLVSVLLSAIDGKQPDLRFTREPYETFEEHNKRIDQAASLVARIEDDDDLQVAVFSVRVGSSQEVIEVRAEASRLLYGLDRHGYIEALQNAGTGATTPSVDEEVGEVRALPKRDLELGPATPAPPSRTSLDLWSGEELARHIAATVDAIGERGVLSQTATEGTIATLARVAKENMYLDWEKRPAVQAGMKIALRRALVQEGFHLAEGDVIAIEVVETLGDLASTERS